MVALSFSVRQVHSYLVSFGALFTNSTLRERQRVKDEDKIPVIQMIIVMYIFLYCTVKMILYTHRQTRGARGTVWTLWTNWTLI